MPQSDSQAEECASTVAIAQDILPPVCGFRLALNVQESSYLAPKGKSIDNYSKETPSTHCE